MIHSILLVQFMCLTVLLPQPLSRSSLVFLLVWDPLLHTPFISSPDHHLFETHAHTMSACFAVVLMLCHLLLISLSAPYLEICLKRQTSIWPLSMNVNMKLNELQTTANNKDQSHTTKTTVLQPLHRSACSSWEMKSAIKKLFFWLTVDRQTQLNALSTPAGIQPAWTINSYQTKSYRLITVSYKWPTNLVSYIR